MIGRLPLAAAAIVAGLGLAAQAFETPAVGVVVDARMIVRGAGGEGMLPVAVSQDWSHPLPQVSRALVLVHGAHRTAEEYYRIALQRTPDDRTLVVAPQFLLTKDITAHSLPDTILRWGRDHCATGGDAIGPVSVSSYDAIDALFATLADRSRFPNLRTIVRAGFSGGGWLTQRYAVFGRGADAAAKAGIAVRYVVGSPASYFYFSDDRPQRDGGLGPFADATACPAFNRWPYGPHGELPRYVEATARAGTSAPERRYAGLDLVYLLGTADNDPHHWELDTSCSGEAEGPDRYDRGVNFFRYMQARDGALLRQRLWTAPGAAHDPGAVLGSPCGKAALFDMPGCAD